MYAMRRISRIIISAVLLVATAGSAADLSAWERNFDRRQFYRGSDVRLSWGWKPIDYPTGNYSGYVYYYDADDNIAAHLAASRYYGGYGYLTGAVNVTYSYRFKRWLELSGVLTYSGYHRSYYDKYSGDFAYRENTCSISVMPYVRFNWLYRNWVRMYSGIGIGISAVVDQDNMSTWSGVRLAGSITPIGIAVGRYFYGLAELSIGTTGLVTVGIGYRF